MISIPLLLVLQASVLSGFDMGRHGLDTPGLDAEPFAFPRMDSALEPIPDLENEVLPTLPPALRTEIRDIDFALGVRAVEWIWCNAQKTIHQGGASWHLKVDDALGGGVFVVLRIKDVWFEQVFDYTYAVLTTADHLTFRTLGLNIGVDYYSTDSERMAFFGGPVLNYADLDMKEGGQPIPGELRPTVGGQLGFRYQRILHESGSSAARFGFSAEAAIRYMPLRFDGDSGVTNELIKGWGIVIAVGAFVQF